MRSPHKTFIIYILALTPFLQSRAQTYFGFIEQIQNYQNNVELNNDGDITCIDTTTFQLNDYIKMFTKLRLDSGLQFRIKYHDTFLDGQPYIYVSKHDFQLDKYLQAETEKVLRCSNKTRIQTEQKINPPNSTDKLFQTSEKEIIVYDQQEYYDVYQEKFYNFLSDSVNRAFNHISPEDSKEGYLQFLFFKIKGELFALKWHSNYIEKLIITSDKEISEIIKDYSKNELFSTNKTELNKLLKINPTPIVYFQSEYCFITWIEFETHNGIYERTYRINRSSPFKTEKVKERKLARVEANFLY